MCRRFRVSAALLLAAMSSAGCDDARYTTERQRVKSLATLQERADQPMNGRVVFLGSSTLARWPAHLGVPAVNLALPGDTVPELEKRLRSYAHLTEARQIVLNIGLNDLRKLCSVQAIKLSSLVHSLPSQVPVLWVGIQGVAPSVRGEWCGGNFERLTMEFNLHVEGQCGQMRYCRYVPHPVPPEVGSTESAQWHGPDGVHLSAVGYSLLWDAIRERSASHARSEAL